MQTLADFLHACKSIAATDVYDLFYDATDELREIVYDEAERLGVVLEECNEPTRASMIAIGTHYKVESLINY